ncbi:hypothetical protein Fmac_026870 [Flemingia macrophylla]|uniref:Uncharacterized protein n=1 Tax=Flemingia macrophylla TaxID=520843 RepID=A0ABD1LGB0_9FABA
MKSASSILIVIFNAWKTLMQGSMPSSSICISSIWRYMDGCSVVFLHHQDPRLSVYSAERPSDLTTVANSNADCQLLYWKLLSRNIALIFSDNSASGGRASPPVTHSSFQLPPPSFSHALSLRYSLLCLCAFKDPGPHDNGRYSDRMLPEVEVKDFRKGAQPGLEGRNCIADEHYLPTFLQLVKYNVVYFMLARRPGGPSHQLSRGGGPGGAKSQSKRGAWAVTGILPLLRLCDLCKRRKPRE